MPQAFQVAGSEAHHKAMDVTRPMPPVALFLFYFRQTTCHSSFFLVCRCFFRQELGHPTRSADTCSSNSSPRPRWPEPSKLMSLYALSFFRADTCSGGRSPSPCWPKPSKLLSLEAHHEAMDATGPQAFHATVTRTPDSPLSPVPASGVPATAQARPQPASHALARFVS